MITGPARSSMLGFNRYLILPTPSPLLCSSANSTQQKMYNWNTLNQKVLKRLGFTITKPDLEAMCNCQVK